MRGFTLVELLTVAAIMLILSGIILTSFRVGQGSLALDRSAHKFAQDMRRAMELALRAQPLGACAISGYGVYVNKNNPQDKEYRIFGDCNWNGFYDAGDVTVEVLKFEKGVHISGVSPNPIAHIFFLPPDPQVGIFPGNPATAQVILQLENDPSRVKTLTINNKGVIDID